MRGSRLVGAFALAFTASGCTVGPDYQKPVFRLPTGFLGPSDQSVERSGPAPADLPQWWRSLRDRQLDSLEDRALAANLDLEVAFDDPGSASRTGGDRQSGASGGRSDVRRRLRDGKQRTTAAVPPPLRAGENTTDFKSLQYAGGAMVTWDLDLFGRIRREYQAQTYDVEALAAARDFVAMSVTADVARDYLDMRGLQAQLAVLDKNIDVARSGVTLEQTRFDRGLTNELDVALARRELETLQAQRPTLVALVNSRRHAIAVLLGRYPEDVAKELSRPGPFPALPRQVPTGAPVQLLRRRPDIVAAERRVAQATANIGVAVAALFPNVSLNGGAGGQGGAVTTANANAITWIGSVASTLYWPLLDFGGLDAQIEIADYTTRERLTEYKQTILAAVQEVDDATSSFRPKQRACTT